MLLETVSLEDCCTVFGLAFDILGVSLIFIFAPEKVPHPQYESGFAVQKHYIEEWKQGNRRRTLWTRVGLLLVIIGFATQALGNALF